ncbi:MULTISPECIES: hypothetical protein [Nonlabens]|uniref:Viral A-type inclusion protein n=2 Tax=Nonlabens ulvanivorans TaxID=906888 RepID=A0A084JTS7_NONUL|nr:hypothetical protein [Nonlabens ulvanivorans]KEZ92361.1 hypothetical protein IL45_09420 [Nonlabens ulvanivorans]PRX15194.1 hypothetical protein LY02_00409 [Nonlabens ulvanivorans]WOI22453.1 hypothetical protein R1T42_12345 [Nonlabens ulvanivorans]GAK98753.1 hypothetical protein JCM19314_2784 [Nonlabens ulvanivorans]
MKSLWTLILLALLASCNDELKEQQVAFDNLKQQSMEAHDVIMPKMGDLMDLSNQLSKKMDSTNTDLIMSKKSELQKAHDDMMTWMRDYSEKFPYDYKLPKDVNAVNKQLDVLKEEHEEIEELKVRTLRVIDEAQAMLK